MNPTYKKLLKKLHEKYPGKHILISSEHNYYDHSQEYKTIYLVYVEEGCCNYFPSLSEAKLYIEDLCKKEV